MSGKDKSLFATTLKRWEEINVIFKKDEVLGWADKKPETGTPFPLPLPLPLSLLE
jgi:hypothetical protein